MSRRSTPRRNARRRALQALYQWQLTDHSPREIIDQFLERQNFEHVDEDFFRELVLGASDDAKGLGALKDAADRPLDQIDVTERVILRLAAYELAKRHETPYRVVLDEALELAHGFGSSQGASYVNGVLDALAAELRPHEYGKRL